MSYVFQATLVDTMRQYASLVAEEYLGAAASYDEVMQHDLLQCATDLQLADDAVRTWSLEDMDFEELKEAFAGLRKRLL